MKKRENIVLIGFMGCGKTSFGTFLARKCKMKFMDTDQWIEQQEGKKISEIFEEDGEEIFRQKETQALEFFKGNICDTVFSTGGGIPIRKENRELLPEIGTVVYLTVRPDTIIKRLEKDTQRPLLQGEDREERIKNLMEQREPYYREAADIVIHTDGKTMSEMMNELDALLKCRNGDNNENTGNEWSES